MSSRQLAEGRGQSMNNGTTDYRTTKSRGQTADGRAQRAQSKAQIGDHRTTDYEKQRAAGSWQPVENRPQRAWGKERGAQFGLWSLVWNTGRMAKGKAQMAVSSWQPLKRVQEKSTPTLRTLHLGG